MEDTTLKQPSMVSRLPKFGFRATPVPGPITNGSNHVSSGWDKGVPVSKQNTTVRAAAPFPIKGRKEREDYEEKVLDCKKKSQAVVRSHRESQSVVRQIRKPLAASVGKTQRSTPIVPSAIPEKTIKTNTRNTVCKQPPPTQPVCSRVSVTVAAVKENSSSSSRGSLQSSLSHSSDSIKSISVENVVRSQSFSYLKRPEATADPPLTRSFSFNRATELAKQMPRPLAQSPVARPPVTQTPMVLDHVAKPTIPTCSISSKPTSLLKKSLLPSAIDGKPSLLSYKLMRPSINKQPRPVLPVKEKKELLKSNKGFQENITPVSEPSSNTHRAEFPPKEHFFNTEASDGHGQSLELSEDMSLSSTSSLERNDVSEEYMDDFDDLGNGMLFISVHKEGNTPVYCQERSSVTSPQTFMSEAVDWPEIGLTGTCRCEGALCPV
ncbi:Serine-rich coiled-coil domain-containing protein 2 [Bagarius yarrelli]|uniref:Serine-rich coiled-coil domain-containing protein 2 n=1 Tax=Bagarius yarrelli TaxID=175774 RepID=A0A556VSP6_BAGYA|nr:Serine-rich coiled-coil domain-containing protein 2 [Bagarius yarrelli]